ncbi:MAG TPA: hypothetical protein VLM37_07280 [Fibrobacteraceae bacterium]|nr:hypothetical protein [Fibrobacteraceae bacterium]
MSRLLNSEDVQFAITDGDLTTNQSATAQNILKTVSNCVRGFCGKQHYSLGDLLEIVHLIDTDGAFIPDEAVVPGPMNLHYSATEIQTNQAQKIRERNHQKKQLVELLRTKTILCGRPYHLYYFSRNLEHVLHNRLEDLPPGEKNDLADQFAKQYGEHPEEFLLLMNQADIAVSGDYNATWGFLQQGSHSLERGCNFHLYLNQKKNPQ